MRIAYILRDPRLRKGAVVVFPLPLPEIFGLGITYGRGYKFLRDCEAHSRQQTDVRGWLGDLDLQALAQAYLAGAQWGLCNSGTELSSDKQDS